MTYIFNSLSKLDNKIEFKTLVEKGEIILLDVRTVEEYALGYIENSINIPLDELPFSLSRLQNDKPIFAICESGIRSQTAVHFLKANGYTESCNAGSWHDLK